MNVESNFRTVRQYCRALNKECDIGNKGLDIEGRSAAEVANAFSEMTLAIGTLEMLIHNLLNRIEISLPEKVPAKKAS